MDEETQETMTQELTTPFALEGGIIARARRNRVEDDLNPASDSRHARVGESGFRREHELLVGTEPDREGLWLRIGDTPGVQLVAFARLTVEFAHGEHYEVEFHDPEAGARLEQMRADWLAAMEQACAQNRRLMEGVPDAD